MKIMGVDPGGTTGVVVIDVPWDERRYTPDPECYVYDNQFTATWGFDNSDEAIGVELGFVIRDHNPDLIAIENFIITRNTVRNSRQPDAMWIIGGLRFLADILDIPVHLQTSSLAKTAWDNERLKETGWYGVVKRRHARDALRHALTACTTWKPNTT